MKATSPTENEPDDDKGEDEGNADNPDLIGEDDDDEIAAAGEEIGERGLVAGYVDKLPPGLDLSIKEPTIRKKWGFSALGVNGYVIVPPDLAKQAKAMVSSLNTKSRSQHIESVKAHETDPNAPIKPLHQWRHRKATPEFAKGAPKGSLEVWRVA